MRTERCTHGEGSLEEACTGVSATASAVVLLSVEFSIGATIAASGTAPGEPETGAFKRGEEHACGKSPCASEGVDGIKAPETKSVALQVSRICVASWH